MSTLVLRVLLAKYVSALSAVLLCTAACAGGGQPSDSGGGHRSTGHRADLLVSGTSTDPQPALPARAREILYGLATDPDATDGRNGAGASARVLAAASPYAAGFSLTPRRTDGSVEHGLNRDHLIDDNVNRVAAAVAGVRATRPGLDLLKELDDTTRGVAPATLIVLSHGLSTAGGFDLRQVGWEADPQTIADDLKARNLLPSLTGWTVIFSGLGTTVGDQPPLPRPTRLKLDAYWQAICTTAGGTCEIDDSPTGSARSKATAAMPAVAVPGVTSVTGPQGRVTYAVSDTLLGFRGDSAELAPSAAEVLSGVAARIKNNPAAAITVTGYCADPPGSSPAGLLGLSRARAQAVADALRGDSLANPISVVGGGVAPGGSATTNGHFDEKRASQMRRVEITF
jgi:outer membrane protein OmpA-like peptidoglycan-associated protein